MKKTPLHTALAVALDLDAEHACAFGADLVLMRDASGAERHGERSVLNVAAAIFLGVVAAEEQAEEREFVRVSGQLAGLGVAKLGEDGSAHGLAGGNAAVESPAGEPLFTVRSLYRSCHFPALTRS